MHISQYVYSVIPPYTLSVSENFCITTFGDNGNFKYFVKNIFAIDPHGQKRKVWHGSTFAKLISCNKAKIRIIRKNLVI